MSKLHFLLDGNNTKCGMTTSDGDCNRWTYSEQTFSDELAKGNACQLCRKHFTTLPIPTTQKQSKTGKKHVTKKTNNGHKSWYKDSRWQQKRLEIMERDSWTCQSCGASGEGVTLNVHHAYYEKGKKPWEYPDKALLTWCEECHESRTLSMPDILTTIAQLGMLEYKVFWELIDQIDTCANDSCDYREELISMCNDMIGQTIGVAQKVEMSENLEDNNYE